MSSFAGYCSDRGKPVMHKTFFGTLHLCLTDEEREAKAMLRQQMQCIDLKPFDTEAKMSSKCFYCRCKVIHMEHQHEESIRGKP